MDSSIVGTAPVRQAAADFVSQNSAMPVKSYNGYLRDLIVTGRAKPSEIVTRRIHINEAPEAYRKFDEWADGYTKVLIKFDQKEAAEPRKTVRRHEGGVCRRIAGQSLGSLVRRPPSEAA
jgi:hypothetical protein